MQRQLYVPPARRSQCVSDNSISDCLPSDAPVAVKSETISGLSGKSSSGPELNDEDEDDDSFCKTPSRRESSEDEIVRSCIYLTGFPPDMSEIGRGNILSRFVRKGAQSRWIGPNDCLLAFKNEKMAVSSASNGNSTVYKLFLLKNIIDERKDLLEGSKLIKCWLNEIGPQYSHPHFLLQMGTRCFILNAAAKDLYHSIKPDMDSSVAHRLIGAALGIKVPTKNSAAETAVAKSTSEKATPVVDAWDD